MHGNIGPTAGLGASEDTQMRYCKVMAISTLMSVKCHLETETYKSISEKSVEAEYLR
jgi:hypothetical protein